MGLRATAATIFMLVFAAIAAVAPQDPGGSQLITRFGLTLSMVEDGTLAIDRFAHRTIDKSEFNGRYFADKPPGLSLLAVPVIALAQAIGVLPRVGDDRGRFAAALFVATVAVNGTLSALAAALLYLLARHLGCSHRAAIFGVFACFFATPLFGWSSAFFSHSVTGSLLLISLALMLLLDLRKPLTATGVGAVIGFTATVDLTAVPGLAALGLCALCRTWRTDRWAAVCLASGALVGFAPLPLYNWLAFGAPWTLGYAKLVGWEGMKQGLFGVGLPDPAVLMEILFGLYRGLLPLAPILLLVPFGLVAMARARNTRLLAGFVAFVAIAYLAINAGYHYWNGGWSMGPRQVVPMLPLLGLALCYAAPKRTVGQAIAGFLLTVSACLSLVCALGGMFPPDHYTVPLVQFVLPRLTAAQAVPALLVVMIWLGFAVLALLPVPARHTEPAEASQHAKERLAPGSNNIAA